MNEVIRGDCLKKLPELYAQANLAIVDPPFNIGYVYDRYQDHMTFADYLQWTRQWVKAVKKAMHPTGTVYVCIGDNAVADMKLILDKHFHFRSWIVWHYTFGVYCESKWGRGHTHILQYTVDKKKWTWNPDPVRVPSDRLLKYKDKRANPKGRVPCDVWTFSRVCGTFKERTGHPCQMPLAIMDRMILASSNPGDVVLDPMCGSGAALVSAKSLGRQYYGIELSGKYAKGARARLKKVRA